MKKSFYITTAIDYVNNLPHIGTAYEKIGADALARFFRMDAYKTHFQMGNDEHSEGVKKAAAQQHLDVKVYCDQMRIKFEKIWKNLNLSYDDFIQTSEDRHQLAVQAFIKLIDPKDIEKKHYEGWYCTSCEAYYTEKDLINGECEQHRRKPDWISEENFFFKLSHYQEKLLQLYKKNPDFILPAIRRNEIVNFVKGGLQDVSISRSSFDWGVPFPNDPTHVVYVWFDALINYLTVTGFGQKKPRAGGPAWPADLHIIGKDITRFHCVIWPAMLMSAQLPLPKTIFGHGFVYLKGERMSKTLGNIVSPMDVMDRYGADPLRYYLLRESSFGADGNFTWDNFIKRYNGDLANDLGNVLNRTLGMTHKYCDGKIQKPKKDFLKNCPFESYQNLKKAFPATLDAVRDALDWRQGGDIEFHKALGAIWTVIGYADKFIDDAAPWKLIKDNKKDEINQVLYTVADTIRNVAILVAPFLPTSSLQIWEQLRLKDAWEEQTFKNIGWGKTPSLQVQQGTPIFPRIETISSPSPQPSPQRERGSHVEGRKEMELIMEDGLLDIKEFGKVELRVAEIKEAVRVEGADKLLKLQISLGTEQRQIVAGIAQHYTPEELIGKRVAVVCNLKPATIRGVESNGMLLAATDAVSGKVMVLSPGPDAAAGSKIK